MNIGCFGWGRNHGLPGLGGRGRRVGGACAARDLRRVDDHVGPDLSAAATLDTANGDHQPGSQVSPQPAIAPNPHNAEDLGVWNDGNRAPAGGQVLQINVKGCAVEDKSSPTQVSTDPGSHVSAAVNAIVFQSLGAIGRELDGDDDERGSSPCVLLGLVQSRERAAGQHEHREPLPAGPHVHRSERSGRTPRHRRLHPERDQRQ